jgi:hypothetical protein
MHEKGKKKYSGGRIMDCSTRKGEKMEEVRIEIRKN